jgi:hypothetical protein
VPRLHFAHINQTRFTLSTVKVGQIQNQFQQAGILDQAEPTLVELIGQANVERVDGGKRNFNLSTLIILYKNQRVTEQSNHS